MEVKPTTNAWLIVIISYPAGLAGLVQTIWQRIQMRRRSS
jgi:hypothetical protein